MRNFYSSFWPVPPFGTPLCVCHAKPATDSTASLPPCIVAGNIASLLMFSTCVILGILFRRKSATHKRLMLLASIPILAPALDRVARIPLLNEFLGRILYWFPAPPEVAFAALSFLFLLLTVVANDLVSERRVQSGTLWGLFAILIVAPAATYVFTASGAWVTFVHWVA